MHQGASLLLADNIYVVIIKLSNLHFHPISIMIIGFQTWVPDYGIVIYVGTSLCDVRFESIGA